MAHYFHESGYGGEYMVGPGIVPAAICFGASAIVLIAVSLFTKPLLLRKHLINFSSRRANCEFLKKQVLLLNPMPNEEEIKKAADELDTHVVDIIKWHFWP